MDYYGREDSRGNIEIYDMSSAPVTQIPEASHLYPVGASESCACEHPQGITLYPDDANQLGLAYID